MSQTTYGFSTAQGIAGGLVDLSPREINTFVNEAANSTMKLGMGVVNGTVAGKNVTMPATGDTNAKFSGVTVNGMTYQHDLEGKVYIQKGVSVGVMHYGKIYARVKTGIAPSYGDALYLVITGDDAGTFTNVTGADAVAIKGRFLGGVSASEQLAPIELYNQAQA